MQFRQLEYFVKIAELRSFRRASEEMHVAQPALTRQIKRLEDDLGVELFERMGRGIHLTEAGSVLLERARFLLGQMAQARADVVAQATSPSGQVSFGAPPSIAEILFPRLARSYLERYPNVKLRFFEGMSHLWDWLANGQIDLAVLPTRETGTGRQYVLETLVREAVYLIGPADDPTMPRGACTFEDIASRPIVISGPPNMSRRWLERNASQRQVDLRIVVETENLEVHKELVANGVGYAMLPHSAIYRFVAEGEVTAARVKGLTVSRTLARRADRPLAMAVKEMVRLTHVEVGRLKEEGAFGPECAGEPGDGLPRRPVEPVAVGAGSSPAEADVAARALIAEVATGLRGRK